VPADGGDLGDLLGVTVSAEKGLLDGGAQRVSVVINGDAVFSYLDFTVEAFVRDELSGMATICWQSCPGGTYRIERSADLETWIAIPGDIVSIESLTAHTFSIMGFEDDQSFRVRSLPSP
jgi:hypothetical protein